MATASRQRLLRSAPAGQLSFGGELAAPAPAALPADDAEAQTRLAQISQTLQRRFVSGDDPWAGSPHAWLRALPPVSRSRAGVALVDQWLRAHGHQAERRTVTAPLTLRGAQIEVRVSTLWDSGEYRFQALREGGHDLFALLGVSPHRIDLWVAPLADTLDHLDRAGGAWLTVPAAAPPAWLAPFGGPPAAALTQLPGKPDPGESP